jgi:hypothetical protein
MKTTSNQPPAGCTWVSVPLPKDSDEEWIDSLAKKDSAKKLKVEQFLTVANWMLQNDTKSFTKSDFYPLLRAYDIGHDGISEIFEKWIQKMIASRKIKQIDGVYNEFVYEVLG